jgi:hypothetical protein
MNRALAGPLCALLMAALLVACGGGDGDPVAELAAAGAAPGSSTALMATSSAQPDECSTDQ